QLFDLRTGHKTGELKSPGDQAATQLSFSPDGRWLAGARSKSGVWLWDLRVGKRVRTYPADSVHLPSFAFSPDGPRLVIATDAVGAIRVWDLKTGKGPEVEPSPALAEVWVSPDGTTAQALGGDNKVYTFGLADGRHRSTVELPVDDGANVFWDAKTKRIAAVTGGDVVEVVVIDTDTAKPIAKLPYEHKGQPFVSFDPADR